MLRLADLGAVDVLLHAPLEILLDLVDLHENPVTQFEGSVLGSVRSGGLELELSGREL